MKRIFILACVLSFATVVFPALLLANVDILSYTIEASIGDEEITEKVTLKATAKRSARKLSLELAGAMKIQSATANGVEVPFKHNNWDLELDLSKAGLSRGEFSIEFELQGKPYNKFSKQRGGFVRTNICPEHAYIRSQYAWYPRVPDDPALYDTTLSARKDWRVRTAGRLMETKEDGDRKIWHYALDRPDRNIGLVAGEYIVVEDNGPGGIKLDAMVFTDHEEGGKKLLEAAGKAMNYFASLYGPVDQDRFSLVEMPAPFGTGSGYGEIGYVLIGTGAFEGGAGWAESLVAHEVSHTWWGHEVSFSNFANEMFATYCTHRYMEEMHGRDQARKERNAFVGKIVSTARGPGETDLEEIKDWGGGMNPAIYSAHAYDKRAMVLHILECEMGRKELDQEVKAFIESHKGQIVDYSTAVKDLGGSRWKWVFSQWGTEGIPRISEEHETKKSGSKYKVSGKLFQEGTPKPYKMNVTLRAVSGDEVYDQQVKVKKSVTAFKFTCPFEPQNILIDPDCDLILDSAPPPGIEELKERIFNVANSPNEADRKKLEKTIADIRKVIAAGQDDSVFHTALGRCYFRLGNFKEAEKEFETALKGGAGGPFHRCWIYLRLGNMADLAKKRSDAESFYKRALAENGSEFTKKKAKNFLERPYKGHDRDG